MKKAIFFISILSLLAAYHSPGRGEGRFYLKAAAGYSKPYLDNLSGELKLQGRGGLDGGYSFNVSLGRSLLDGNWAVEAYFAFAFYPEFDYMNEHEDFRGDLSRTDYAVIVKRRFMTDSRFIPSIGAGVGYGTTNLISGGGKLHSFEALARLQIESPIRDNISLLFDLSYTAGLKEDDYDNPFLENIEGDVLKDSEGNTLEDRPSSMDVRIGLVIWLKPLKSF